MFYLCVLAKQTYLLILYSLCCTYCGVSYQFDDIVLDPTAAKWLGTQKSKHYTLAGMNDNNVFAVQSYVTSYDHEKGTIWDFLFIVCVYLNCYVYGVMLQFCTCKSVLFVPILLF